MALHPTYASLYTGAGGLDLGFELALPGARPVLRVERDAAACAVLVSAMEAGRMAPSPLWTDAFTLDSRAWRSRVDWLVGGPPCQPFSVAGKQLGRDDPRNLWPLTLRLVWDIQPVGCFFENVPSADSLWYIHEEVIPGLQALEYEVTCGIFSAAEVGAPHLRERLFILADRAGARSARSQDGGADRGDAGADAGGSVESERGGESLADAISSDVQQATAGGADGAGRAAAAGAGRDVGDASGEGLQGQRGGGQLAEGGGSKEVSGRGNDVGEWPPGPADADAWAAVLAVRSDLAPATQPRVRALADGLAGGPPELGRADALRILGNGVVVATAARAFRVLSERLT